MTETAAGQRQAPPVIWLGAVKGRLSGGNGRPVCDAGSRETQRGKTDADGRGKTKGAETEGKNTEPVNEPASEMHQRGAAGGLCGHCLQRVDPTRRRRSLSRAERNAKRQGAAGRAIVRASVGGVAPILFPLARTPFGAHREAHAVREINRGPAFCARGEMNTG
jgi:hypothetical protein